MENIKVGSVEAYNKSIGYSEITWIIDNYFSKSCRKNWVIQSPDFDVKGSPSTRWRIYLKPRYKGNQYFIQTSVERSESDSYPDEVQVKWTLSYSCGEKPFAVSEGKGIFGRNGLFKSWIYNAGLLEKIMVSESCWIFSVRCKMLVFKKHNKTYKLPEDIGLRHLTRDMQVLYWTNKKFDVLLHIGNDIIRAHKALLCARNEILKEEILKQGDTVSFHEDLSMIQKGVASDFIAFIYTANIDYILKAPSFSMKDLIDYFNVSELQNYYLKDEMTILSNSEAHVFSFCWHIKNYSRLQDDCIESPKWEINADVKFQIRLYPKGLGEDTEHMFLFGEFMGHVIPHAVYFACGVGGEKLKWKFQRWSSETGERIGFEKFVSRNIISDNSEVIGCQRIICRLIIPVGTAETNDVVKSKTFSLDDTQRNHHFRRLSADLEFLWETGRFSDVMIATKIIRFTAHKMMLSYRSHVLEERLRDLNDGQTLPISDVAPNILRAVFHYIYSGVLKNTYSLNDIKAIYAASVKYCILSLKTTCSKILEDNLGTNNVLEIVVLSNTAGDSKLRKSCFKLICYNFKHIYGSGEWYAFVRANSGLYKELLHHLNCLYRRGQLLSTDDFNITDFINT